MYLVKRKTQSIYKVKLEKCKLYVINTCSNWRYT